MVKTSTTQLEQLILESTKKQNPQTTAELMRLIESKTDFSSKEIMETIIQLDNEDKIKFDQRSFSTLTSRKVFPLTKNDTWYYAVISLTIATCVSVFAISENEFPIVYLRYALSMIFLFFLSGYALIKLLFPAVTRRISDAERMDFVQRSVLSVVMSIILLIMAGLALNYTSWGITLTPITLSLVVLTTSFASAALIREHKIRSIMSIPSK